MLPRVIRDPVITGDLPVLDHKHMDTAAGNPQRWTASVLIGQHDVRSQAAHAFCRPLIAGHPRPYALIEAGDGSQAVDYRGHPFRIGLRQAGVGRIDGGQRGEVPTPHACVKDLEVHRDHGWSAWLRRFGGRLGIRRCSTGSQPIDEQHYEETE